MSIEDQIRNASANNERLLGILARTDYAAPALKQQIEYIRQLEAAIARNNANLQKLAKQREKEHKDHRKYVHSHFPASSPLIAFNTRQNDLR
jgi:hypothetical protein